MKSLVLATAIAAAAFGFGTTAQAMPQLAPAASVSGGIVQVAEGCGPGGHRTPYGRCVPNYRPAFRGCPPRMHLDRFGHCRPNF